MMTLSKKNAARQSAIHRAIASGKALGGLLVGLTAATVVGGCKESSPSRTQGSYPRSQQQANATNENTEVFVTEGVIAAPEPEPTQVKPNAVRERQDKEIVLGGKPLPPSAPPLPQDQYRVKGGDTLTKIAKTHGTTVAELKRLNGFDDVRANKLIAGEVIKVPQSKTNAVREVQGKGPVVRGEPMPLPGKPPAPKK
jgi:LysM repeat protein